MTASAKSRDSFRDTLLAAPLDVEALAGLGRRRNLCPYYGARAALPEADLVLLPYGALLLEVPHHTSDRLDGGRINVYVCCGMKLADIINHILSVFRPPVVAT